MKSILKRLLLVAFQFVFPFRRGRRLDVLGYLLVFVLLFIPMGGWKIFTSEISASEEERIYGEEYDVPGFRWARIRNRYGVQTAEFQLRRFENCLLRYRGRVTEITNHSTWWSSWKDQVLVEYTPPEGSEATGVLCPEGTLFYISREELQSFPEQFDERQRFEEELVREVSDLRINPFAGEVLQVDAQFTWVEVVNPEGVENFGYRVPFLDICGIEAWGSAQHIGTTSVGDLYLYTPYADHGFLGLGIPCPAATLFLFEQSQPSLIGGAKPPPIA